MVCGGCAGSPPMALGSWMKEGPGLSLRAFSATPFVDDPTAKIVDQPVPRSTACTASIIFCALSSMSITIRSTRSTK